MLEQVAPALLRDGPADGPEADLRVRRPAGLHRASTASSTCFATVQRGVPVEIGTDPRHIVSRKLTGTFTADGEHRLRT